MTIVITDAESRPALTYNQILVKSFIFLQDEDTLKRKVEIVVKPYAIDPATNDRVLFNKEYTVQIDDFDTWVFPIMVTKLGSVEAALSSYAAAKINSNGLNIFDCMAAFQAGTAKICAEKGVFTIQEVA